MKYGVLEISAIAWLVAGPLLFVVLPDVTVTAVLVWALGLAALGAAVARRHPSATARNGSLASVGWTLVILALTAYTWIDATNVDGGELGAFIMLLFLFLPLWIIGLLVVRLIVKHARRTIAV